MFDQLASLNTSRTTWRVKVRVTRMWPSISTSAETNEALKGYNLLLVDDDNCHVQAFVYSENWRSISNVVAEGSMYIISNFYAREALGTLRPTSSKILINFSNSTTVEKLVDDDFMIPMHKFELVDLGDLLNIANETPADVNPTYATDVIGVLEDFERVRQIKTVFGERDIVKFRITDGRYSHKVTLWSKLALEADKMYDETLVRPIIVIVTSTKLKTFKSSVQISSLPSSKVYMNLNNDYVHSMRQRVMDEGYKPPEIDMVTPVKSQLVHVTKTVTITELSEKHNMDDFKKNFICRVKIATVEETSNWWYNSCLVCQDEVLYVEGKFKCLTCKKNIPVAEKRYKIVVLTADSTEASNFILLDRASKRLIGQTATKVLADNKQSETTVYYPDTIKKIVGKEITLNIQISDDNVLLKSKLFEATDAYDGDVPSTSKTSGSIISGYSISNFAENIVDLSSCEDTPGSAKSCSKKMKKEP